MWLIQCLYSNLKMEPHISPIERNLVPNVVLKYRKIYFLAFAK